MFLAPPIYLASASPRRRVLLDRIGVPCRICPEAIDETPRDGEEVSEYVMRMAQEKALATRRVLGQKVDQINVLAADTIVALDNNIFGKPQDRTHAAKMLTCLSGRKHRVMTAVVLLTRNYEGKVINCNQVTFMRLSHIMIEQYLDTGEYRGKAGAYAIQGFAEAFVENLEGSFSGVMGLPLNATIKLLRRAGLWMSDE